MTGNVSLTRKQTQFLHNILLGQTIVAAAAAVGISEKTAHAWLKKPALQAELERLKDDLCKAEEAEITHIMTTGLAATHRRVEALSELADILRKSMNDPETGEVEPRFLAPDKIREYRGALDDIAKEVGGRVKKQSVTGTVEIQRNPDLTNLTNDELDQLAELLTKASEGLADDASPV